MASFHPTRLPLDSSRFLDRAAHFRHLADDDFWMRPLLLDLAKEYEAEATKTKGHMGTVPLSRNGWVDPRMDA